MSGYPTTDTFASLIDEVIVSLQGYGATSDQVVTLSTAVTAADLALPVDTSGLTVGRGIVEVDEELIYVLRTTSGSLIVPAWGRGWKGTTAAAHSINSAVYVSPAYPRSIVSREINNTIRSVYPDLFAVATTDITTNPTDWQFELPSDLDRVLSVDWKYSSITQWEPLRAWEVIFSASTSDFTSGKALAISEGLPSNTTLHVTYATQPTLLTSASDTFASTGLPTSARDVIVYGAAARLIPWMDVSRIPVESVASDAIDQARPLGGAVQVGREVRNLHLTRLAQEKAALLHRYPLKSHRVR
jgi:hypothetical protein